MMLMILSMCAMLILTFNAPLPSILFLIMITLLLSMMIHSFMYSAWLPLIIFLMMVGGMLVLFIYMASISPNKKSHNISKNTMIKLLMISLLLNLILTQNYSIHSINKSLSIYTLINTPSLSVFSVSYLFIFLLILSIILKKKMGPLRSK